MAHATDLNISLHFQLYRPHQCRLRGLDDEPGCWLDGDRVRLGRRHSLCRLLLLRDSQQPRVAAVRRTTLAVQDHDHLQGWPPRSPRSWSGHIPSTRPAFCWALRRAGFFRAPPTWSRPGFRRSIGHARWRHWPWQCPIIRGDRRSVLGLAVGNEWVLRPQGGGSGCSSTTRSAGVHPRHPGSAHVAGPSQGRALADARGTRCADFHVECESRASVQSLRCWAP